jgi:hypothetical protein
MSWNARSLRLTIFMTPDAGPKASGLNWEELTGDRPENITNRGDQQQLQEGPYLAGRLLLQKQLPGRVDVVYAAFQVPDQTVADIPVATLGPLETACETMRGIALKMFEKLSGGCTRFALGAEMVSPAQTSLDAYKQLVEHMGSATFAFEGGQEFMYQINRPRDSKVEPGLKLNRLTRWNASSWQVFQLTGGAQVLQGLVRIGAVITTDLSTDEQRSDPLPAEKMPALYDELCALNTEIRDKGDIK